METTRESLKNLIEKLEQDAKSILISPKTVTERLMVIGAASFARRLCLRIKYKEEQYLWGDVGSISELKIIDEGAVAIDANYEILGEELSRKHTDQEFLNSLARLAKALWGTDIRKHGAITFDRDVVKRQIGDSLAALVQEGNTTLGVVFIDLDHFKQLNSHITQSGADKVIQELNRRFHDMTREFGGLAFNRSGDEFFVFLPYEGLLPVLQALHKMRSAVKSKVYMGTDGTTTVQVDMTMGIAPTSEYSTYDAVESATDAAEALTKDKGNKRRGSITIAGLVASPGETCSQLQLLKLGATLVRRRLHCYPFSNPCLNFLSQQVAIALSDGIKILDETVSEILVWLRLSMESRSWESSLLASTRGSEVPRLAVALTVAHGVARGNSNPALSIISGRNVTITYAHDGSRAAVVYDGKRVWGSLIPGDPEFVVFAPIGPDARGYCLVGVQVGLSDAPCSDTGQLLPADIFDEIVLVDERPISGGSLPDFWQPAIAEVFSSLGRQNTKPHVIVWGPAAETSETYKKLAGIGSWRTDEVARVSKLPATTVESLRKDVTGTIKLVGSGTSLIDVVFAAVATWPNGNQDNCEPKAPESRQEALTRPMLSLDQLPLEGGIRCRNAAQAYPIIIDVLRKGNKVRVSTDEAKWSLKELLAFKLILEEPLRSRVPAYLDDLKEDLNNYAQRAMLDKKTGLFRKLLESTKQVDAFIKHLSGYMSAPEPARSTRRACLVVPNSIDEGCELRPLGLLNVWASPRVGKDRHLIDFVFVWRTVEAFVGLPYSLFGSIRLAEDLVNQIALAVPKVPNGQIPTVGELTYIPMSLHMRVDEFHDRIAKRIVDESSD